MLNKTEVHVIILRAHPINTLVLSAHTMLIHKATWPNALNLMEETVTSTGLKTAKFSKPI